MALGGEMSQSSPLITLRGVRKVFGGIVALEHVDLEIYPGEVHAIMGENGAGKSTLVKILSGVHRRSSGQMLVRDTEVDFLSPKEAERNGIAIIHQELNLIPNLSVAENILLGREPLKLGLAVDYGAMTTRTQAILDRFDIKLNPRVEVGQLRIGEQQLVEIARAMALDADVLILDEPTSALSEAEAQHLSSFVRDLADRGTAIVYISHRMNEVFALADKVTVLRDGKFVATNRLSDTTQTNIIRMMVGRSVVVEQGPIGTTSGGVVLSTKGLGLRRADSHGQMRQVVQNVSFDLHPGEIFGIGGLLGSGRTEVLELIFGSALGERSGWVSWGGQTIAAAAGSPQRSVERGLAFITEDRKGTGLLLGADIRTNAVLPALPWLAPFGWVDERKEAKLASKLIRDLAVRCTGPFQPIGELSGGNQQKIVLGKWLATKPAVILLDEPTRGIDVGAKDEIYAILRDLAASGVAIVLVSSELPELLALSHRIGVMCEGRLSGVLEREQFSEERVMELGTPGLGQTRLEDA
jgi:ribose transport system ATP-binding protein